MTNIEWTAAVIIWVGYLVFQFTSSTRSTGLYLAGVNLALFVVYGAWVSLVLGLLAGWNAALEEA